MKRNIAIILLLILTFHLYSCNGVAENNVSERVENSSAENTRREGPTKYKPYKYGIVAGDYIFARNSSFEPVKYNVHDGKMSHLCPDPFCNHHFNECEFMGFEFQAIGNTVYFAKQDDITGKGTIYSFDPETAKITAIYSVRGSLNILNVYDYRLLARFSLSESSKTSGCYFWYDTKTGKTEDLLDSKATSDYAIYQIRDDLIIWKDMIGRKYYCTDLSGKNLKEYDFGYCYGNYYKAEFEEDDDGNSICSLYVTFRGESEKTCLIKDVGAYVFYENKIVYFKCVPREEQRVVHVCSNGTEDRDIYGGNVYVMNPDGTDNHLLLHTDEFILGMTSVREHPQVSGEYFGIIVAEYEGDAITDNKLIIANINTGEFVVTHD